MKNDRFLIAILAGIILLAGAAIAVFFLRQSRMDYRSDDLPENIVYNYVLALQRKDFDRAYGYIADGKEKPSAARFRAYMISQQSVEDRSLIIVTTTQHEDEAFIQLTINAARTGLFSDTYHYVENGYLVRQNGAWKIQSLPYPYWNGEWSTSSNTTPAIPVK